MITGQYTGKDYVTTIYNNKHSRFNDTEKLSNKVKIYDFVGGETKETGEQEINSLKLNKLYVLTSGGTASASELTITGLKSYIEVITIGSETYGKFVGSVTLVNEPKYDYLYFPGSTKHHKWAMQPIVFSYHNADNDPHPEKGILPNYEINSIDYYLGLKEFGNMEADPALRKAYELITGTTSRKRVNATSSLKNYELISSTILSKPFGTEMYIEGDNLKP